MCCSSFLCLSKKNQPKFNRIVLKNSNYHLLLLPLTVRLTNRIQFYFRLNPLNFHLLLTRYMAGGQNKAKWERERQGQHCLCIDLKSARQPPSVGFGPSISESPGHCLPVTHFGPALKFPLPSSP